MWSELNQLQNKQTKQYNKKINSTTSSLITKIPQKYKKIL
jgi:hypothetical protein